MISIKGLSKTYKNNTIKSVDDISFDVENGEICAFIGANGAGKSTTIKCLTGILDFESGTIELDGYDIKSHGIEAKKAIGYVPDDHVIYEALTGIQYINFISDIFGVSEQDRKARTEKYAKIFGLSDKLQSTISSYSHGMKQKISIIATLVHDPSIFILDEPMTGLDPQSSYELKQIMIDYAKSGKTVLFSSHVLEVVEKLCTKVVIIDKGQIKMVCAMDELKEKLGDSSLESIFLSLTGKENSGGEI
ncbi:MAG: ABC transporter ATP-binding protein [Bacillota bacterium]